MKKVKIVFLCIAGMLLGYVACMSVFGTYGHEGVNSGQDFVFVPDAKRNVLFRGSVDDYLTLKKFFETTKNPEEFVYYSLIMANKYDYVPANFDVYDELTNFFQRNGLGDLDTTTYCMAMSYLKYGVEMGDSLAIQEWERIKLAGK